MDIELGCFTRPWGGLSLEEALAGIAAAGPTRVGISALTAWGGRIFSILAEAGFSGPCWVECVGGRTLDEINEEARKGQVLVTKLTEGL